MTKVSRIDLSRRLDNNVCEIIFVRRRPERAPGRPITRKMICCNSMSLLNSRNGKLSLNFRLPSGPKQINESFHNLVVTWDIFMQDYRNVSMEYCYLIREHPADETFWKYYNNTLYPMSKEQKLQYMDSL